MNALKIVIADDESIIRMDLKEMLQDAGHQIVGEAVDGEQAVRLCRDKKPDLAILDIKMPKLDGLEAATLISQENLAGVLILTAFSQKELVKRAQVAGVFAYLVKPFKESDLLPAIEIAIVRYREMQVLREEAGDLKDRLEARKVIDKAKGKLMKDRKLTEPLAYNLMRQMAMDQRKTLRDVAEGILKY